MDDYFKSEFYQSQLDRNLIGYKAIVGRSIKNKVVDNLDKSEFNSKSLNFRFNYQKKCDKNIDYMKEYDSNAFLVLDQKIEVKV